MAGATLARSEYQPALDGIRAFAIAGVLLSHLALPAWTRTEQGFVGVYAFFALSGYLITSLLLAERERFGDVSLRLFWGRRAARLLPALAVLVAASVGYSIIKGGGGDNPTVDAAPAVLFYVGNWVSALGGGDGALGSLSHTWSLSVEEQFYIVWPLLLLAMFRFGGRRLAIGTTIALIVVSVTLRFAYYDFENQPAYRAIRGTDSMADMLLYGCLLALLLMPGTRSAAWLTERVAPLAGVLAVPVLLAVVLVQVDRPILHLAFGPLAAIATAALILTLTTNPSGRLGSVLGAAPLAWLGRISYSLYLWHISAFLVLHNLVARSPLIGYAASLVLALGAAAGSYYVVEQPILRRFRDRLRRQPSDAAAVQASQL